MDGIMVGKQSLFRCVECDEPANEGSMQHPYCEKCFQKVWHGDYDLYAEWLKTGHACCLSPRTWRWLRKLRML